MSAFPYCISSIAHRGLELLGAVKVFPSLLTASSPFFPFLSFTNFPGFSPHSISSPCTLVSTSSSRSSIPISSSCNLNVPCIFLPPSEANLALNLPGHCSCSHHKACANLIHSTPLTSSVLQVHCSSFPIGWPAPSSSHLLPHQQPLV